MPVGRGLELRLRSVDEVGREAKKGTGKSQVLKLSVCHSISV